MAGRLLPRLLQHTLGSPAGAPLEQRDCALGSVCLPTYRSDALGYCLRACVPDDEAAPPSTFGAVDTTTGICAPAICMSRGCLTGGDCSC